MNSRERIAALEVVRYIAVRRIRCVRGPRTCECSRCPPVANWLSTCASQSVNAATQRRHRPLTRLRTRTLLVSRHRAPGMTRSRINYRRNRNAVDRSPYRRDRACRAGAGWAGTLLSLASAGRRAARRTLVSAGRGRRSLSEQHQVRWRRARLVRGGEDSGPRCLRALTPALLSSPVDLRAAGVVGDVHTFLLG